MNKRIGFIGTGNMAQAIIGGLISGSVVQPTQVFAYNPHRKKAEPLREKHNISLVDDVKALADCVDIIIIAVKPNTVVSVLSDILGHLRDESIIVSIAAGVTLASMETMIGKHRKIVRLMPNTPALVIHGMTSVTPNANVSSDELKDILAICNGFGKSAVVPEYLIDAVVGVSGSAPAYVFMFIEAMADAAVLAGMPRELSYQFAAQAVLGSAKMVLETGRHPAELKDRVCSPGGTTIEAVKSLENDGFRAAVMNAVGECIDKSKFMSGQ